MNKSKYHNGIDVEGISYDHKHILSSLESQANVLTLQDIENIQIVYKISNQELAQIMGITGGMISKYKKGQIDLLLRSKMLLKFYINHIQP